MNRERWQQIDTILKSVLERPAGERAAFLDRACAGDAELRREVESLVAHDAESGSLMPTVPMPEAFAEIVAAGEPRGRESRPPPSSPDSFDRGRFVAGTMLSERYRIITLLGRGGMGEVYKAEDLKLEQTVALKFLPESLSADGAALARLYREVRTARQISHRNVCRVYDIGEADGLHFLSMEFVPGEELASLLRRIGRLPGDKAVEVARQLCAGLAAAHANGVLHRDLKPANVMIDDAGNVRVTDFGLAGLAEEFQGREIAAGTPAYMAPEQLAGREVTIRSDVYALGLVLYEIFTGKRAFAARTLDELLRLRETTSTPTAPSSLVKDLDPLVERVIERCLEKEPERRPASAMQVAAALPGGDPIAAALAAGETPSPEMVAAAPKEGSLRPGVAAALLAFALLSLALTVVLSDRVNIVNLMPFDKPPEVLADRAATLLKKIGHTAAPVDTAYHFSADFDYYLYFREKDQSMSRLERLRTGQPAAMRFNYRQSPHHLEPEGTNVADDKDPSPLLFSGMASVRLDPAGRLIALHAVPPQIEDAGGGANANAAANSGAAGAPDWASLFAEAGLDITKFAAADSRRTPPVYADARAAWDGVFPLWPEIPLRVEAASYRGRPVYFELTGPWTRAERAEPEGTDAAAQRVLMAVFGIFASLVVAGVWMARRNLQLGRGDRKGAFRLALFVFLSHLLGRTLGSSHTPTFFGELWILYLNTSFALFWAALLWVLYVALEPHVRRRTPNRIISWSRLVAGGWRDPLVGRDVLVAVILGVFMNLSQWMAEFAGRWAGVAPDVVQHGYLNTGFQRVAALMLATQPGVSLLHGLGFTFLLLLLGLVLRGERRAAVAAWAMFSGVILMGGGHPITWPFAAALAAAYIFVSARFGLLAITVAQFVFFTCEFYPYTTNLSAWYAGTTIFAAGVVVALALYGFYTSLAGQPLFKRGLLGE